MYLKIINRKKTYYILVVKDNKQNIWVEHFINATIAQVLIDEGIKVVEY